MGLIEYRSKLWSKPKNTLCHAHYYFPSKGKLYKLIILSILSFRERDKQLQNKTDGELFVKHMKETALHML